MSRGMEETWCEYIWWCEAFFMEKNEKIIRLDNDMWHYMNVRESYKKTDQILLMNNGTWHYMNGRKLYHKCTTWMP